MARKQTQIRAVNANPVTPVRATRGRRPRFAAKMERQISVGIDPERDRQLRLILAHLRSHSAGDVGEADVFRQGFDLLASSLLKEVPELAEAVG